MSDEGTKPNDDGVDVQAGGRGRARRSHAERREFANVVLHWAASANAMRAVVDKLDASIESLRGTGEALDVLERDRKVSLILATIRQFAETERLSLVTRGYLQELAESLMAMSKEPPK